MLLPYQSRRVWEVYSRLPSGYAVGQSDVQRSWVRAGGRKGGSGWFSQQKSLPDAYPRDYFKSTLAVCPQFDESLPILWRAVFCCCVFSRPENQGPNDNHETYLLLFGLGLLERSELQAKGKNKRATYIYILICIRSSPFFGDNWKQACVCGIWHYIYCLGEEGLSCRRVSPPPKKNIPRIFLFSIFVFFFQCMYEIKFPRCFGCWRIHKLSLNACGSWYTIKFQTIQTLEINAGKQTPISKALNMSIRYLSLDLLHTVRRCILFGTW